MENPVDRREPLIRSVLIAALLALLGSFLSLLEWHSRHLAATAAKQGLESFAPPELAIHADAFRAGAQALQGGRADSAIEALSSFSFGERPVEQYRLFYLATAQQLAGRNEDARRTLAQLWRLRPTLVYGPEAGFQLAALHAARGSHVRAGEIYGSIATTAADPKLAALARESYLKERFITGDLGAVLLAAHNLHVENPDTPEAATAAAILRSLRGLSRQEPLPLTPAQRIRRAEAFLALAKPKAALEEMEGLQGAYLPRSLDFRLALARGDALHRTGRYEDSDRTVEPLFAAQYRYAIPALEISARNQRALADAIDAVSYKTVKVRERAGTRVVTRRGKRVRVPNYRTINRRVKEVNPTRKAEREKHESIWLERLRDLRSLPIEPELRKEVLTRLVAWAEREEDEPLLRQYVRELVETDPADDTALQSFWDRGWEAYASGNTEKASDLFNFIAATYRNPNIRRQATYWFGRSIERSGRKDDATQIYREIAAAPYEDLYALYAKRRLGADAATVPTPAAAPRVSWEEIAEADMPDELRLAYELNALGVARDARLEVQRNASLENRQWADAILGDLYFIDGETQLANRYLRRAWPELATVEQNVVPWRFLEMYYPLRYEAEIREGADKNEVDPYLLMALIRQESAFNPDARSHAGAIGLMQLMPATGRELGNRLYTGFVESRLSNPDVNVELGSHYLRRVLNMFDGDPQLALAGYNGGPYRIRNWRRARPNQPLDEFLEGLPLDETRNYVKRITLLRSSYEKLYGPQETTVELAAADPPG